MQIPGGIMTEPELGQVWEVISTNPWHILEVGDIFVITRILTPTLFEVVTSLNVHDVVFRTDFNCFKLVE